MQNTPAQLIKIYIDENGLKQKYIAQKIEMNPQTLNAKLNGKSKISVDELIAICNALGKEPNDFIKSPPGGGDIQ